MSELRLRRRILGIDLGKARVGVAVSDELGMLAHPLETIPGGADVVGRIAAIVAEKNVERVVVGLPRHMNGSVGTGGSEALAFAGKLQARAGCVVTTWDERMTTIAATRALRESGRKARNSRGVVDQVAAQMILQSYLDALSDGGGPGSDPVG
ncbi:MAG TPA: Holliday junction resolvase RuvX [Chthoniobacterales bacterium]|jgi:putative Holliday junction resolvase|nr:Holliday junction resolvase RuvX [Chthoniobacterales bacterium]